MADRSIYFRYIKVIFVEICFIMFFLHAYLTFKADNESEMKNWVTAIDVAATAVIVDERKDVNKLRKLTSFRFVNLYTFHHNYNNDVTGTGPRLVKVLPAKVESLRQK